MSDTRPPLAQGQIDRDARTRNDPKLLHAAWQEPGAQVLYVRGLEVPVVREPDGTVVLTTVPVSGEFLEFDTKPSGRGFVYLGRRQGTPIFGAVLTEDQDPPRQGAQWVHPFAVAMDLNDDERELLGILSALARWHEVAGFSSRDGSVTTVTAGGWARIDEHGVEYFPRTDPAVIVLIEHDDRVLLGSNVLWESGRFSILAGFVEAGESLEQAVAREVYEESGMRLAEMRYVTSQPWPFPRSLMLGFRARLAPGQDPAALVADTTEISELRWFTRAEILTPPPGIILPQRVSIARWLLDQWAAEGDTDRV